MRIGFRKPGCAFVVYLRRRLSLEVCIRSVNVGFVLNPGGWPEVQVWFHHGHVWRDLILARERCTDGRKRWLFTLTTSPW